MSDSVIQSQLEPVVYSSGGEVVIPWLLLFIWNGEVEPEILKTTLFVPDGLIITFLFIVLFFSVSQVTLRIKLGWDNHHSSLWDQIVKEHDHRISDSLRAIFQ